MWLSAAGGISVSYVYMHLLPELAEGHALLPGGESIPVDYPVFLTALIGLLLNVLNEELPEERRSRFWAFFAGVVFYTALLLYTEQV